MNDKYIGIYKIQSANGEAFRLLGANSSINLDKTEAGRWTVTIDNPSVDGLSAIEATAVREDRDGNLIFELGDVLQDAGKHEAVLSGWEYINPTGDGSREKFIFGEIFDGDPNGAGGFGGQQGG